jgi:HEAT repeat protein
MPDYINWMRIPQPTNSLKLFCIKEIELFDKREDAPRLYEIFKTTDDNEVRGMILRTLGKFKYTAMEEELMQVYNKEKEFVKRSIAIALMELGTGNPKVVEFLKEKYTDSKDINTSMTLLNALYNYGPQGQAVFKQLEACCDAKDKLQFKHIQDPLTNDRAYEL